MPTYTRRTLLSETAEVRIYEVEGVDDDGDAFFGVEHERKTPEPSAVLAARIDDNLAELRDRIGTFDTDTAAVRWITVKLALRVVLALARLVRGRTEVDG